MGFSFWGIIVFFIVFIAGYFVWALRMEEQE